MGRAEALGLILPVLCVAVVLIAAKMIPALRRLARPGEAAAAAGVGIGVCAAFLGMFGWPGIPAPDQWRWLATLALLAGIVLAAGHASYRRVVPLVAALIWIAAVWYTLALTWLPLAWLSAIAVGVAGIALAWSMTARSPAWLIWQTPAGLIWLGGLAAVLIGTGQARFTQLTVSIALAWIAAIIVAAVRLSPRPPAAAVRGAGQAALMIGTAVWFAGWGYQDASAETWLEYTLLLAALIALGATFLLIPRVAPGASAKPPAVTRAKRWGVIAGCALSVILAASAAAVVHRDTLLPEDEDDDPATTDPADLYSYNAHPSPTPQYTIAPRAVVNTTLPTPRAARSAGPS